MSIKIIELVRQCSAVTGSDYHVLLALAGHAHPDGTNAYPSVALLARECHISARQVQRCLRNLESDGLIVGHEQKGCRTNYTIVLEPLSSCHPRHDDRGDMGGVSPLTKMMSGVTIVSPPKEPSVEPSEEPSHTARARGVDQSKQKTMLLPISGSSEPAGPLAELLLAEFQRCAGHKPGWGLADVRAGLAMLGADRPADGDMLAAAQAYRSWLAAQNAKRKPDNPEPMTRPSKWLSSGAFLGFLPRGGAENAEIVLRASMADDLEKLRGAGFSNAEILAWFAKCEKFDGAPVELNFASDWWARWVAQHFGSKLQRMYGEDVIIKSAKKERAA
jgi:hypothetical protein